ncbi:F-box DNA helicase 1 [Alosa sapidissima]|uniref:F-box DNA helicase 1 n=1 Tax=Alosa sapidissima TaxID=34773 RepID=UPI001C089AD6|nr:F-box DNA helicase 1 [Alosa sapidissima]XP_041936724.1 F-box DNA helicase 1 [Alosa sapidissima]XP_041936725.1 F-box DNA helicase 1 [Alosa sapidissima]
METAAKGKAKRRHLSASECVGLGQSTEGTHPLTEPQMVPRSSKDPNRGLYPRTPTKRKRRASNGGVDNQKDITQFYPITGVMRVSPQKAVTQDRREEGAGAKATPTPVEVKQEVNVEEDSTPVKLKKAIEQEVVDEDIDYMEGITEDMFGDDDDFEREGLTPSKTNSLSLNRGAGCSSWEHQPFLTSPSLATTGHRSASRRLQLTAEQDETSEGDPAEPLPDSCFGLLGVREGLQVPQGQLQHLPEEVLRQVFGLLPAVDLYGSIQCVCRSWRDIVADPKFVPWKKLYFRYQRREPAAVKELNAILSENHLFKDELSLVNMFRYMTGYKHSTRVNLECVLRSVSTHRLYPQALACITHLKKAQPPSKLECVMSAIPSITGGASPWCVMAVMLLLADGVGDVLQLVRLLQRTDCLLTPEGASEYLWAVATLLIAMKDKGEYTCGRLHYNIYYVLQMLENIPIPLNSKNSPGVSNMRVTHEQQLIINHDIQSNHVVKIMAFAGTGKTTTLVEYARSRPHLQFLYVAFNKSVQTHAQRCFPPNVHCKTIHSMAFRAVGTRYQQLNKLSGAIRPFSVAWVLPKGWGGFVYAKVVSQTINKFCASRDERVMSHHVPSEYKNQRGLVERPDAQKREKFVSLAQDIWTKMTELRPTREMAHHITHDGYLKLWQLQKPVLDGYDVIFIDEAQDCTPAIMDIVLSQSCGKMLVGDPHQQIYTFRGAVNALHTVPHTHVYYLTQSFRFGPEIAFVGASILSVCKGVKKTLVGTLEKGNVCGTGEAEGKVAILSRCNESVFSEAVKLMDANPLCKIHFIGGVDNFGLKKILDIWVLMQPTEKRKKENLFIQDAFIRGFSKEHLGGYGGLRRYATHTDDRELEGKLNVVERYHTRMPDLIKRIYSCSESTPDHADYIVGTVHKAKGLEFESVMVTDDFAKIQNARPEPRMFLGAGCDEWNLMYVAVTRAKKNLTISPTICNILTMVGECFLRSELTSVLQQQSPSLSCCIRNCPNLLNPQCPLAMRKLPVKYLSYAVMQGPVCVQCVQKRLGPMAFLLEHQERLWQLESSAAEEEQQLVPVNVDMLVALL